MKKQYIKNFATFIKENYNSSFDMFSETPDTLKSYDTQTININDEIYSRFLETDEYIFFEYDQNVLMYDKKTLNLISDNHLAENELLEIMLDKNYTWASDSAIYSMEQQDLM